jgi:hypothetical protein
MISGEHCIHEYDICSSSSSYRTAVFQSGLQGRYGVFLRKCGPKLDTSVKEGWRTAVKVMLFENARGTCDTDTIHLNASSVAKKVDIRGQPASMITVERNSSQSTAERQERAGRSYSSHRWLDASWFPPMTRVKTGAVAWPV